MILGDELELERKEFLITKQGFALLGSLLPNGA